MVLECLCRYNPNPLVHCIRNAVYTGAVLYDVWAHSQHDACNSETVTYLSVAFAAEVLHPAATRRPHLCLTLMPQSLPSGEMY